MKGKVRAALLITGVLAAVLMLHGCRKAAGMHTIAFINIVPDLEQAFAGFKEKMTELGYREGKQVRYIYEGPTTDINKLPEAVRTLMESKPDLILSISTPATLAVKQATAGTDLPVVFTLLTDPVGAGIVDSMQRPGGNITGIMFGTQEERRLEYLVRAAPAVTSIYVPFNPKDRSPVSALEKVRNAAKKLGVKLITREVTDAKTLDDAITNLPPSADAVFLLPDSLISTRLDDLVIAATKRKLPTSAANVDAVKNHNVLVSFGCDLRLAGKQAARLVDQIFRGVKPDDLPVEMTEFYLALNLKTADAIGLSIPDEMLRQATIVVR